MAKFRMVPENIAEAEFIAARIDEYVDANIENLSKDKNARGKVRQMLEWQDNWHGIVTDLREEGEDEPPVKAAPPAKPPAKPAPAATTATKTEPAVK